MYVFHNNAAAVLCNQSVFIFYNNNSIKDLIKTGYQQKRLKWHTRRVCVTNLSFVLIRIFMFDVEVTSILMVKEWQQFFGLFSNNSFIILRMILRSKIFFISFFRLNECVTGFKRFRDR